MAKLMSKTYLNRSRHIFLQRSSGDEACGFCSNTFCNFGDTGITGTGVGLEITCDAFNVENDLGLRD
jgi:hypothetical protein